MTFRPARKRPVAPRPRMDPLQAGPWVGMRDAEESAEGDLHKARYAQNVYPVDLTRPSPFVGRPGARQTDGQGGSGGARTGQLITPFTEPDGTVHTVRIVGGRFETYDWSADAWTNTLTAAQLSGAGVTLSATARCHAVTFAGQLVISDGVNKPWAWDGTAGAGITPLTNAPVAYGPPTVYAAKLFFIKATERTVIVWSEENQPNTGYEAGGYNNAWTFTQTDSDRLFLLVGGNEALDVFRAASETSVSGAVNQDFQTTHTRESGSETIGTISPAAAVVFDKRIFFLDSDFRPHVRVPGGGVQEIWSDCAETLKTLSSATQFESLGIWDPVTGLVLFAVCANVSTVPNLILAFNPKLDQPQFVGVWTGWEVSSWGVVVDASGIRRLMFTDSDGFTYYCGTTIEGIWDDELADATVPIAHSVESRRLGYAFDFEKTFYRVDFSVLAFSNIEALTVGLITPGGTGSLSVEVDISGSATIWDNFDWDDANWSAQSYEQRRAVGFTRSGRWCHLYIAHSALGERFGLGGAIVQAAVDANYPGVL